MTTYNGRCNCEDCTSPAAPETHLPRLEAAGDVWPVTA